MQQAEIDFRNATLKTADKEYAISPVGTAAQELVVDGRLQNWVKKNL